MGLGINHFVNIVTNESTPNPHPVPVESLGIPGSPQGSVGECKTLKSPCSDGSEQLPCSSSSGFVTKVDIGFFLGSLIVTRSSME